MNFKKNLDLDIVKKSICYGYLINICINYSFFERFMYFLKENINIIGYFLFYNLKYFYYNL